jgi:hypothetical protein
MMMIPRRLYIYSECNFPPPQFSYIPYGYFPRRRRRRIYSALATFATSTTTSILQR